MTEIAGTGTGEGLWEPYLRGLRLPPLDQTMIWAPVVVAPHPDDEILGIGGLLAALPDPTVIAVTDGEASHPGSTRYTRDELAQLRQHETAEALRRLGQPGAPVVRLRHPDGGIDEDILAGELVRHLTEGQFCFATWRGDGHPDHETVGRAAARACALTSARLIEYPIWTWHWARPGDDRVPWNRARQIPLTPAQLEAKAAAIQAFVTQIEPLGPGPDDAPILPPHILARFHRPYEVVFR